MEQQPADNEDRIKQLVKAGNRLEAAAVYADREHVSFQQAREYIDKTFPISKPPIKDDFKGCPGVATFASKTNSYDDKGRSRPGDSLLRREQDQLQTANTN